MSLQIFQDVIQLIDQAIYGRFMYLPIIGGILGAFFFVFIIYISIKTKILLEFLGDFIIAWNRGVVREGKFSGTWNGIQKAMAMPDELSWHKAIIASDDILNKIIEEMGYAGTTTDERMQHIDPRHFPYFDEAMTAHKIALYFEQDPNYRISREAAEKTFDIYKRIFEELGVV